MTSTGFADIEALSRLLAPSHSLQELCISGWELSAECTEAMFKTVLSPSSLKRVKLNQVTWTDEAITLLEENNTLAELQITPDSHNLNLNHSVVLIARALCKNCHLKILSIYNALSNLNDEALSMVAEMLSDNQTLKTMTLYCKLTLVNLLKLNAGLQLNQTLETLKVLKSIPSSLEFLDTRIIKS